MLPRFPTRRGLAVLAVAAATLLGAGTLAAGVPALAGPANTTYHDQAAANGTWLSGQLADDAMPGFGTAPDWGLTIDALFALEATGADPAAADKVATNLAAHVRSYDSEDDYGIPGVTISGAAAKILVAAEAAGKDPTDFGGNDMRQAVLDLMKGDDAGDFAGRFTDHFPDGTPGAVDNSNTFGQSLAVIGLADSGGVPQQAVDFLIRQQCAAGGFRLSPDTFGTPSATCDASPDAILDPDSTGMAVQALLAADKAGATGAAAAATKGLAWLQSIQGSDGSFGGSGPTAAPNTNSTGLAGQALAAGGKQDDADRAAGYVAAHQLTADNAGKASGALGAIAYNDDSLADAQANGIADFSFDQWRRASAQAVLALAQVPLYALAPGKADPTPSSATPTASTPASTKPTTSAPTSEPTTEAPTATASSTGTPGGSPSAVPIGIGDTTGTGGTSGLPVTGAPLVLIVAGALGLLVAGTVALVAAGRRRRAAA